MLTATRLHARGLDESNAGRHSIARRTLRRALERADDNDLLARIRVSLAHVESELGSADRGLVLCNDTLGLDGVSRQVRGLTFSQIGLLQMRAGNGSLALPAFAEAIRLLDSSVEPRATAHMNRAILYLQRGDLQQATRDLEVAVALARSAGLDLLTAKVQHNLGYAKMLAGDLASALSMMEAARPSWALSPVYAAQCDQDRAEALLAAGMTREAASALEAAAKSFGARRLRQRQAEAEFILARLLLPDDPHAAGTVARRASRRFSLRGSEVWALRADAVALAAELDIGEHSPDVVLRADQVIVHLRRQGLEQEADVLHLHLVRGLIRWRLLADAIERLGDLPRTRNRPVSTRLLDREVRASLAWSKGRPYDAARHLRRGLAELHAWQSSFGSLDLRSSLVGHGRRLAVAGLLQAIDDGRPDVVFEWSERARALASRVTPVRPPVDDEAAGDLAMLRRTQLELGEAHRLGGAASALRKKAIDLSGRIRQRAWYDEGSGLVTEPVALEQVRAELSPADGVLLCYLVVAGRVHVLAVTATSSQVLALGGLRDVRAHLDGMQADLDMAASDLPAGIGATVQASLEGRLRRLDDILVQPLRGAAADGPAVIVPSGALAGMPWSLLPGLAARPLTVPRSASSWLTARPRGGGARGAGFVAGPRVERAVEEVSRAGKAWRTASTLVGRQAHASAVHELASRVDVLHVAAHGRHSAENPLFSGLELVDGPWFGYDVDRIDTIPATVILSACEVGRSSVRWGEETLGMTVAWLHAGTGAVIASPASVNDHVACEVLTATHARLAAGVLPSMALAGATRDVATVSPAAFICFGSGW